MILLVNDILIISVVISDITRMKQYLRNEDIIDIGFILFFHILVNSF